MGNCQSRRPTTSGEVQTVQPGTEFKFNNVGLLEQVKAAYAAGGLDECRRLLERKRDEWKNTPLNVAVIGNSGVGKSSFINSIRGLNADDEGAAEVGVTQTIMEPRSFPHPDNPMLTFWDLPGVGTDEFPRASYLEQIDVDRYDFFLLLTADRFTENDTWLGREFQERNKKHFFVRTKIEVDISNNKKAHSKRHNEEAVVAKIRQATEEILTKHDGEGVPLFLIDSYELDKFDFENLKLRLIADFPDLKRSSLILSLQSTSVQMIRLKVAELRFRASIMAGLSALGLVGDFFIPGTSFCVNIAVITGETKFYFKQLGLDNESLQRYATLHSADYERMQSIVHNKVGIKALRKVTFEGMKMLAKQILTLFHLSPATTTAEESTVASLVSIGLTTVPFLGTHKALNVILHKFEEAAADVMQCVALSDASTEEYDVEMSVSEDAQSAGTIDEEPVREEAEIDTSQS